MHAASKEEIALDRPKSGSDCREIGHEPLIRSL